MLYELACLINPELSEDEVAGFVRKLEGLIAETGKVQTRENPKKIGLSYPIKKQGSAFLFSIIFEASAERIETLKTQFEKDSEIMRFLLIKTKPKAEKAAVPRGLKEGRAEKESPASTAGGPASPIPPMPVKEAPGKEGKRKPPKKEEKPLTEKTKEGVKKVEMEKIETELNKILNESQ